MEGPASLSSAPGDADLAVDVANLSFQFDTSKVLVDLDLHIRAGEFVVLAGPSGAGKTTLLTLIGGLRTIQTGSIRLAGSELRGLKPRDLERVRTNIGFIFQDHNLFEALTTYETLRLAMSLFPQRYTTQDFASRPAQLLEELRMPECIDRLPSQMSTGQKQRVAIGRALINNPGLILADEPTAALDQETAGYVHRLLRKLVDEEAASIIMVTHDRRIFELADRVIEMVDGRLV